MLILFIAVVIVLLCHKTSPLCMPGQSPPVLRERRLSVASLKVSGIYIFSDAAVVAALVTFVAFAATNDDAMSMVVYILVVMVLVVVMPIKLSQVCV